MFGSPARSALISGLLHGAAILAILALTGAKTPIVKKFQELWIPSDIADYQTKIVTTRAGGGGGGMREKSPATYGQLPRFTPRQFVPAVIRIENEAPILPMEPTLVGETNVKQAMLNVWQYGLPSGPHGPPSAGPGKCCGIGSGEGDGVGDGHGAGAGRGDGPGGVFDGGASIGMGAVTCPVLLSKTEPEYSEEARKAKLQGTVILRIEVNTRGRAQNVLVRQGLGLGLDERAAEAVRTWRFKAGTVNGKPVTMVAVVEVTFRLL
jgi:TonB family protein